MPRATACPSLRPSLRLAAPTVLALVATLALAACGSGSGSAPPGSPAAGGVISVTATDTACDLSATTAPAGTVTFAVTNAGTTTNEFYLYGEGDRIVSEVENITPGLTRTLTVELTEPATLQSACKPGMVGDGIRADFTITGTATKGSADAQVAKAITDYRAYVAGEADELVTRTGTFVAAVKALYAPARHPWETIEPVAESFGDLDPRIDGREDVARGQEFTGYRRLEKDLWMDGLQPDSDAVADQLLADVTEIAARSATVEPTALSIANGAKALLDEVATGKITGEEERWSHADLWDFDGNLEGSRQALATLRPVITERDPALQKALDARCTELSSGLATHRTAEGGYVSCTALTAADLKALTVSLDALAEEVAKVPGAVAS